MSNSSNYISAAVDYDTQQIMVWERDGDERSLSRYPNPYYFYIEDENGEFESLYGKKLTRLDFETQAEFEQAGSQYRIKYESDISPLDKVLMENYYNREAPKLRYAFLDIEVDYKQELGFSSPDNPYAPINAITIYFQWLNSYVTVVVPPPEWKGDVEEEFGKVMPEIKTELIVVASEYELLLTTLKLIEQCDLLSGWNSDFYDMPYLVKRTEMVLGRNSSQKWCFPGARYPKFKEVEKFGVKNTLVKLTGRVHLDYLQLFKKFTFEGRASYALANIADEELSIPKLDYDGTLEELYHNDFIKFIKYNIRDTEILTKLDEKFNFIALANQMAHNNTVPLDAVLGTVKLVETGMVNYAHNTMKKIVNDKELRPSHGKVEGAIVMTPRFGLHEWIGSIDLTSLYPSCIRALNISSEKIIGQFTNFEDDWHGIWKDDAHNHILVLENNEHFEATGKEWKDILKQKAWAVSAYGTVFDQSSGQGIIAAVLTAWFNERKELQAEKKKWGNLVEELEKKLGQEIPKDILKELKNA